MAIEGLILAKVVYDMYKSDQLNEQAENRNIKSFSRIAEAQIAQQEAEEFMNNSVLRLINRKKAILTTSMKDFLELYEKIVKINFIESDGITELSNFTPALSSELHMQISSVQNMPQLPTITKNVVIGFLIGNIWGAVSSSIVDDAKKNVDIARMQARQADIIVQQSKGINLAYQAITERANQITNVLTKLNILFVKGIRYTNTLIEKNGLDKKNYNLEDRKSLAACINIAGAVKNILDVPIIDRNGEITQKSLEMIQLGEECLKVMDCAMKGF